MLWSGFVSRVGASHWDNLTAPFPLGEKCPRKITMKPLARQSSYETFSGSGADGSHLLGPDNAIYGMLSKPLVSLQFNMGQTFEEVLVERSVHCIIVSLAEIHLLLASDVHIGGIPVPSSTSRCGK